jgi:hypothetical protein
MKGVIKEEGDVPSNTKLSGILLDLVKSRVFSMFQYSLIISIYSERNKEGGRKVAGSGGEGSALYIRSPGLFPAKR